MKLLSCVCMCVFSSECFGQTCFRNSELYASILKAIHYLAVNHLFNSFIPSFSKFKHYPPTHTQTHLSWHNIYHHVARHNCSKNLISGNKRWFMWSPKFLNLDACFPFPFYFYNTFLLLDPWTPDCRKRNSLTGSLSRIRQTLWQVQGMTVLSRC